MNETKEALEVLELCLRVLKLRPMHKELFLLALQKDLEREQKKPAMRNEHAVSL